MSYKYAPPFATLALEQNAGGAYTRDVTFSFAIMPSLDREMFSGSVDAGFVLALPFHHRDLEPDCVGVSTRVGRGRGVTERKARGRIDATEASGRLASFGVKGRGSRVLPRSSWCVHRCCGQSAFAVDNLTICRKPTHTDRYPPLRVPSSDPREERCGEMSP